MAKVTFYTHVHDSLPFSCDLIQTIVKRGQSVLVWVEHQETLAILDQMLWTFDAESFLSHDVWQTGQGLPTSSSIVLGSGATLPVDSLPVVLNLSQQYWHAHPSVERVLELVGPHEDDLSLARGRFKAYRQADFEIEHHNMSQYIRK